MIGFPTTKPGMTVGLLGGSFDPPHEGHVHITKQALKAFGLSKIWWLVSPSNPIKINQPQDLKKRFEASKKVMRHPSVIITNIEDHLKTKYTAETLQKIQSIYPGVKFVWLMGADNLVNFHRWDKWTWILKNVSVGVLARPGEQIRAGLSPAATYYQKFRLPAERANQLAILKPPNWTLLIGPMRDISSTRLRNQGVWP